MSVGTEPTWQVRPNTGSEGAILVWLDALASGRCPPKTFLRAIEEHFQGNRDGNWEVLSLLDQYYRLGKIDAEVFRTIKSSLQAAALGTGAAETADHTPSAASRSVTAPVAAPRGAAPRDTAPAPRDAAPLAPREAALRESALREAAPREAALRESALRESALREAALRESALRESAPREAALRESALRESALRDLAPREPAPRQAPPAAARPARREVAVGDVLRGRYRVRRVLGDGGMGTVFEASDEYRLDQPANGQRVAIKVLHAANSNREQALAELQLEFQNLQSLSHPNIVRVHEFDRDGDVAFFTMELLTGALLSRVLSARNSIALPRPQALAIIRDVGAALAYAHGRGVVHGDVNPQNIFITNEGELRVLDFGAASKLAPVATPGYASCQVLEGQRPDARDDLFAFACVVYVLLTGHHPFPMRSAIQARSQRLKPARPAELTHAQWKVLREGLRWDRNDRPADIQEWLDRFDLRAAAPRTPPLPALLKTPPQRPRRTMRTVAALVMLALLAAAGYWAATNRDAFDRGVTALNTQLQAALAGATALVKNDNPPAPAPPDAAELPPATPADITPMPEAAQTPPAAHAPAHAPTAAHTPAALAQPAAHAPPPATHIPPAAARVNPAPERPSAAAVAATGNPASHPALSSSVRIELAADTVDVLPGEPTAQVAVRRKGSLRGDAIFSWWTESGTAKPGKDFTAVVPHVEHIADGSNGVTLSIPVSDAPRTRQKSFYVVIDRAEAGPALGARTLTMVTLQTPD